MILDFFSQNCLSKSLIRSFPLSDLSESHTVAHLSWATWAIRSRLLISSEGPERFTHGRSFVLSYLSKLLTFAHLIWAKWANEQISDEQIRDKWMSEFPALLKLYSNIFRFQEEKCVSTLSLTMLKHCLYWVMFVYIYKTKYTADLTLTITAP